MSPTVMLCADSESLCRPELIGLSDERLEMQPWLSSFASGVAARRRVKEQGSCGEAWVISSDDVEAINLAAALKHDACCESVYLVAFQGSGSLRSRVSAAGLDGLLDRTQFTRRYLQRKRSALQGAPEVRPVGPKAAGFDSPNLARSSGETTPTSPAGPGALRASETEVAISGMPQPKAQPMRQDMAKTSAGLGSGGITAADSKFLRGLDLGQSSASRPRAATTSEQTTLSGATGLGQRASTDGAERQAFVLVVASASGGSGKSTVATLAAVFAQGLGYRALLLDADLQFGDVRSMLGAEAPCTLDALASGASLPPPSEGTLPSLVAAPQRLEDSERLASLLPEVLKQAGRSYDVVVVNTGSLWAEQHAVLFERASRVLFLIDQRTSSLRASKHALELCARCGIPTTPFLFVVNRCKRGAPLSSIDASCGLQGASVVELRDGGREVDELMGAGLPLNLIEDENPLCVSVENVLADILPEAPQGRTAPTRERQEARTVRQGRFSRLRRRVACLC